ncbi:uncharacterized protein AKAME5_000254700 [Lates japonicus]|uniref:Integrase zinc-binding domain-containing protein n=1 Tax=Lates japonicus TaxID=270547 RepID=A0AAD3M6V4_LATJO|nr:uncharacterized protein AKAME5_000254700 [Lates japonicus]
MEAILEERYNNPGTRNHNGVRSTRDGVVAAYHLHITIKKDVADWIKCCHHYQLNDPIKTVAPVLHPIKVNEAREVVGMDLIGPLRQTARKTNILFLVPGLRRLAKTSVPRQASDGNCCRIFMLMYAICICTGTVFDFLESDMPSIRKWWCFKLMERFFIEGHGQHFAY